MSYGQARAMLWSRPEGAAPPRALSPRFASRLPPWRNTAMRTIVRPQRALTVALIAAALAALGCSDAGQVTAPARFGRAGSAQSAQTQASPSIIDVRGPRRS